MALGAHAGVDEDLGDGVLGGGGLLVLVGAGEVGDVVGGVVEADVLECVGYAADYVVLADGGHGVPFGAGYEERITEITEQTREHRGLRG